MLFFHFFQTCQTLLHRYGYIVSYSQAFDPVCTSLSGRIISRSAEGDWSRGGTPHLRGFRRRGHEVFFCQQRHRCGVASAAARQGGMKLRHHCTSYCFTPLQIAKSNACKKNDTEDFFLNVYMECKFWMMKVQWKVQFPQQEWIKQKGFREAFFCHLCFSALLSNTTHSCQVYADVFLCLHQAKSEMQVEFYVSDIQEVWDRFAVWSQLWHLPSCTDTWIQPDHMSHRDLLSPSVLLSVSCFHPHPYFCLSHK